MPKDTVHILYVINFRNCQGYYAAEAELFAMEMSEIVSKF